VTKNNKKKQQNYTQNTRNIKLIITEPLEVKLTKTIASFIAKKEIEKNKKQSVA